MTIREDLPEDIEALKALVLAQRTELAAKQAELCSHVAEIERLKLLVAKLRRLPARWNCCRSRLRRTARLKRPRR